MDVSSMRRTAILAVQIWGSRAKRALGHTGKMPVPRHNAAGSCPGTGRRAGRAGYFFPSMSIMPLAKALPMRV